MATKAKKATTNTKSVLTETPIDVETTLGAHDGPSDSGAMDGMFDIRFIYRKQGKKEVVFDQFVTFTETADVDNNHIVVHARAIPGEPHHSERHIYAVMAVVRLNGTNAGVIKGMRQDIIDGVKKHWLEATDVGGRPRLLKVAAVEVHFN